MKLRICGSLSWLGALCLFVSVMQAQIRPWEQNVQVQVSNPVTAFTADGYGLHVITAYLSSFEHYLIGNDGQVITANSNNLHPTRISEFGVSITSSSGIVSVVFDTTGDKLVLHQSTNGGASWTRRGYYDPSPHSVRNIDAFEERRNDRDMVHIVWDSDAGDAVYYVRYEGPPNPGFSGFQTITNIGGITGKNPKVITSSDRIHVSFVTTNDAQNKRATTRDFVFSSGQWENTFRQTNVLGFTASVSQQNLGKRSNGSLDSIHILAQEAVVQGSGYQIRQSRRTADGSWVGDESYTDWVTNSSDQGTNYRRTVASVGDTLYAAFNRRGPSDGGIKYSEYKASSSWSALYTISPQGGENPLGKVTINSSATGIYVIWETPTPGIVYMARKAFPLAGSIAQNMFWTDSNWVSGDLTVESGVTVTAKTGSVTSVMSNKKITVNSGGTLTVEPGATFNFESGASIEVQGTLTAQGSAPPTETRVIFTSNDANTTWGGMVVQNSSSAPTTALSYADIVNAGTGVRVGSNANFSMTHCVVDGGSTGLEIFQSGTGTPSKSVTNCLFSDNSFYGILLNSFSNITISDDTCSGNDGASGIVCLASSPSPILRNRLYGLKFGLYCDAYSSPVLEDGRYGGYNKIINNGNGVVSVDGTPVLGFISGMLDDVGGQNDICGSSEFDVALSGESIVEGENNWWGTDQDPKTQFNDAGLIDYDPWLTSDPNPNRSFEGRTPGIVGTIANSQGKGGGSGLILSPGLGGELARLALEKRTNGEFAEAAVALKSILTDPSYETDSKIWALKQLLAVAQRLDEPAAAPYLRTFLATHPALTRHVKAVLPFALLHEGQVAAAMTAFDENIQLYPNSDIECAAIYGKFLHALYGTNDPEGAGVFQARLESNYPDWEGTRASRVQLQNYIPPSQRLSGANAKPGSSTRELPRQFSLAANYPNPFNPSTTIEYSIPQDGQVSLDVFDVLGRRVAKLESGFKPAGSYAVRFDASGFTSGVYFYRLRANGFTMVKKMMLIK